MPTRVIRGEINSSESLSQVSINADWIFRCMLMVADDFGRLDGRLRMLQSQLCPLRDGIGTEDIDFWLEELASVEDPPILRYEVDGRPYIWLTKWEKHRAKSRRAKESKFPAPPENPEGALRTNTGHPRISQTLQGNPPVGYLGIGVSGNIKDAVASSASDASHPPPSGDSRSSEPCGSAGLNARPQPPPESGFDSKRQIPLPDPYPDGDRLAAWLVETDGLPDCARGSPVRAGLWAVDRVREWVEEGASPSARSKRTRLGWYRCIQKAIRKGWGLEGFEAADNARRREQVEALEARHAAKAPPVAQEIPEGLKGLLG